MFQNLTVAIEAWIMILALSVIDTSSPSIPSPNLGMSIFWRWREGQVGPPDGLWTLLCRAVKGFIVTDWGLAKIKLYSSFLLGGEKQTLAKLRKFRHFHSELRRCPSFPFFPFSPWGASGGRVGVRGECGDSMAVSDLARLSWWVPSPSGSRGVNICYCWICPLKFPPYLFSSFLGNRVSIHHLSTISFLLVSCSLLCLSGT